jgi:adenine phosphoribosyltransferase
MHYLDRIDTNTLNQPGLRCRDITPIFADAQAFNALLDDLLRDILDVRPPDIVAGVDGLGLLLAAAVAQRLAVGIVPIRKAGKLPVMTDAAPLPAPRGALEVRQDAFRPQQRVLLVDDWIRTGVQALAAASLIEYQKAQISGVMALNIEQNDRTEPLQRYKLHTVMVNGQRHPDLMPS